jgi:hypothetical protein
LYAEDKAAEIERRSIEVFLRPGVFERLHEIRRMWREDNSSEERDYCSQVSRYPLSRRAGLACFGEIEFLLE